MSVLRKAAIGTLSLLTAFSTLLTLNPVTIKAAEQFRGQLENVTSVVVDEKDDNIVYVNYNDSVTAKITFLEDGIFRFNVDPTGTFAKYATPRASTHAAKIQQYPDESSKYSHPNARVVSNDDEFVVSNGKTSIVFDKDTAKMTVKSGDKVVFQEKDALVIGSSTVQTLEKNDNENFYGGGTQNGRFVHTGESINIVNEGGWTDGQVSSPNPFYWSTAGYGVLRNTFATGKYNFGKTENTTVSTTHDEAEFDAYYFVSDGGNAAEVSQDVLQEYYKVTGNPVLLPEYGFYEGHLNCYNRDSWNDGKEIADPNPNKGGNKTWSTTNPDGSEFLQTEASGTGYLIKPNLKAESLVGDAPTVATDDVPTGLTYPKQFAATAVLDRYFENDMPLGYFVPNDGYGCGYGQNGYGTTGGVTNGTSSSERTAAIDANVANLQKFTEYANSKGVATGLWTQSYLTPDSNSKTEWHLLRDFEKEVVVGGITTLKTDVAWVGPGYSMQLDGVKKAYDIITTKVSKRPNIISLDGWAGSQRFNSVWTGDQQGGNWEYIRFHIPTYIGQSLAGNPNIGSDMDGIFGGSALISTRDYQWKAFTPQMLNMDGWGSYFKGPHSFADPYKSTSRMYLKLKSQLMPYMYTAAASAANIDTNNDDTGLPMIRAMFLEYPDQAYAFSKNTQYQYMFGDAFLVAPVYKNTQADATGNDIRNDIYLPEGETWIDYFTGKQYRGGTLINNFDAPLWKLPLFVKNGSIVPMYEENNTPTEINKANRIVEFWPAGNTEYTVYEDDGSTMTNNQETDADYGKINNISYGDHASTKITSKVDGDKATLTANKAIGSYNGFDSNKNTTFVVNVSKEPTSVVATNGSTSLTNKKVDTKDAFDKATPKAGEAIYFYDANPVIETYANEYETVIQDMVKDVTVSPKLYVKFAETDATANAQKLVINGFVNDGNLPTDGLNESLSVPTNVEALDVGFDYVTLTWDAVDGATSYDVKADGEVIYSDIKAATYTHEGLNYLEDHTYEVRAVNHDGYSEWSPVLNVRTADNPYRNVPTELSVSYDHGEVPKAYAGKFEYMVDGNDSTEYSSSDSGVFNGKSFTIDMNKVYSINKLEYAYRSDGSNGTIQNMKLSYSNDGVTWKQYNEGNEITTLPNDQWPFGSSSTENASARYATFDLTPFKARFLKITTVKTSGGYLQAYEIRPYHVEGDNGIMPGDFDQNNTINGNDEVWLDSHHPDAAGSRTGEEAYEAAAPTGAKFHDLNENGIFDAQDITMLTSKLNDGVKEKKDASGILAVVPSAKSVKAGENFTVDIYGSNLKNVYAFDFELPFNKGDISLKEEDFAVKNTTMTPDMKVYEYLHQADAVDRVYATFTNLGSQPTLNGDMKVATVNLRAAKDLDLSNFEASFGLLVGSSLNMVNAFEAQDVEKPDETVEKKLEAHTDIIEASAKSTGPTGDGNDIWASLDGDTGTYTNSNYNVAANAHPQVYTFKLAKPTDIFKVGARPRGANYSQLSHFKVFVSDNGQDWTQVAETDVAKQQAMSYVTFDKVNATYVKLELTPESDDGNCVATSEVEIWSAASEPVTAINFADDNPTELFVGRIVPFNASVEPIDAANKLYTMTSDNENVKVITSVENNEYHYSLLALKAGEKANIIVTSLDNELISKTVAITVSNSAYTAALEAKIAEAESLTDYLYTEVSMKRVTDEVAAAKTLLVNGTQDEIDRAELAIKNAIAILEFKGSDSSRENSKYHIDEAQMTVVDATVNGDGAAGVKENVLDNDPSTIYHSTYSTNAKLPVFVTVDLGYEYDLEQVDYLARQNSSNGDITHYRVEVSLDGTTFKPVVEGILPNNGYELENKTNPITIKFAPEKARYVKLVAIESIGDQGNNNNKYASISELDFYGTTEAAIEEISFAEATESMFVGNEHQLTPITKPSNSKEALTWASSDETVATVDANGLVKGIKAGETTINATTKTGDSAEVTFTVEVPDKSDLEAKVNEAKDYKATVENDKVVAFIDSEIAKANAVIASDSVSEADILAAINALDAATAKAESTLDTLADLDKLAATDLSKYDPAGQEAFTTALNEAKGLANDPVTNLDELIAKVQEVEAKKADLVPLDTTALNELIKVADTIDLNKYVDGKEKDNFIAVLENAKKIAAKPTTVSEIQDATKALLDAENALILKMTDETKDSLNDLLNNLNKLDQSLYTKDSVELINQTIAMLEEALANEQLSDGEARSILEIASSNYSELELIKTEPVNPGDSGNTGTGSNTGDTTNRGAFLLMLLAAGATVGGLKYKNRKKA